MRKCMFKYSNERKKVKRKYRAKIKNDEPDVKDKDKDRT